MSRLRVVDTGPGRGLSYLDAGRPDGPVAVLLHSLGADHRMWLAQVADLGADHRILAPDCRGHGRSAGLGAPDMARWVDDLGYVLDHAGVERAVLVGVSLGGMQAVDFAARWPGRVAALVVADSFVELDPAVARAKIDGLAGRARADGMSSVADRYLADTFEQDPLPAGAEYVRDAIARLDPEEYAAAVRACFGVRIADRLPGITAPTLVLWGERDQKAPRALSERIAAGIPGARLRDIPAAGHLSNIDNPIAFGAAVRQFLDAAATIHEVS